MNTRHAHDRATARIAGFFGVLLLLPAIAVGCSDQPLPTGLGESAIDVATLSAAHTLVPLQGALTGQADGASRPFTCEGPATSSNPIFLEGQISHLGQSTAEAGGCNTVTGFSFPTAFVTQVGSATIRAANGDLLYGDYVGSVNVNVACTALTELSLDMVITGGTGRFDGASGNATITGTQIPSACASDPNALSLTASLVGQISTVGSNKNH